MSLLPLLFNETSVFSGFNTFARAIKSLLLIAVAGYAAYRGFRGESLDGLVFGGLAIDFYETDDQIKTRFSGWLKNERRIRGIAPKKSQRGKVRPADFALSGLKAITVYRLRHAGLTFEEIKEAYDPENLNLPYKQASEESVARSETLPRMMSYLYGMPFGVKR